MKDRINTISIREIKNSFKRFLTIVLMSLLGVGTFVGLSATSPDMVNSLDAYYDNLNVYDLKVVSTLGVSNNMIEEVGKIKGVKDVYGVYSKDVLTSLSEDRIIKIVSLSDNINEVELIEGLLPKNNNEIVVEELLLDIENLKIGDYITLSDNDFSNKKLKITGTVKSPLFIQSFKAMPDRGNTNLGNGKINYYAYVDSSCFTMDYYTEMYITVDNALKEMTNSNKYNEVVKKVYDLINKNKSFFEKDRYLEIYNEYKDKIDTEKEENEKKLNTAKDLLDASLLKIKSGKIELDKGKSKLDSAKEKLDKEKTTLNNGKKDLDLFKEKLDAGKTELDNYKKQIEDELKKYSLSYSYVLNLMNVLDENTISKNDLKSIVPYNIDNYNEVISFIDDIYSFNVNNVINKNDLIDSIPNDIEGYDRIINFINAIYNFDLNNYKDSKEDIINLIPTDIENYNEVINTINYYYDNSLLTIINNALNDINKVDSIINSIPNDYFYHDQLVEFLTKIKEISNKILELEDGIKKIESGYQEYYKNKKLYEELLKKYNDGKSLYNKYLDEYNKGLKKYKDSYSTYTNGLNLYNKKLEEYYRARRLFEEKIDEAYKKLNDIPESKLYLFNRLDDSNYSAYIDDANSISNLSKLFPVVFYIVAVLICLVSMSRMVEDDRGLIGTLKSLGFSNKDILKKYLLYSFLATIIGGVIGSVLGFYLLSHYIFDMYKLIFSIDKFVIYYDLKFFIIGILIAIICICGTSFISVIKNVKEKPASLMRPKSPPSGKRVLLEKISFIWNRFNFSNKITTRNLLRYKKRGLLTIIGIIGCTALLLAGFAIRDSIINIPSSQYGEVFTFDDMVYLSEDKNVDIMFNIPEISNYSAVNVITGTYDKNNINLFAPDKEEDLKKVFIMKDKATNKELSLKDGEVIISDKISELSNTKVGDYISFTDFNGKEYKFKISGICINYVGHYIIMNKSTLQKQVGDYSTNVVFYKLKNIKNDDLVSKKLLENKNIMSILSVNSTKRQVDSMLKILNSVVLILILLSGGLSVVVLYNLSFINISERRREIATLKVLGFTNKEVDNYINKETIILTIVGIAFGLIFGIFLSNIIVSTVEISMVRFIHKIEPLSYIMTAVIIMIFTLIINLSAHFSLKKIDMIESLKSVE